MVLGGELGRGGGPANAVAGGPRPLEQGEEREAKERPADEPTGGGDAAPLGWETLIDGIVRSHCGCSSMPGAVNLVG